MADGYGAKDRVAIEGGSAGGLLMGAVVECAAGVVQGGAVACAVRGCDEHDAGCFPAADSGGSMRSGGIRMRRRRLLICGATRLTTI